MKPEDTIYTTGSKKAELHELEGEPLDEYPPLPGTPSGPKPMMPGVNDEEEA